MATESSFSKVSITMSVASSLIYSSLSLEEEAGTAAARLGTDEDAVSE